MFNFLSLTLLLIALIAPVVILIRKEEKLLWRTRYVFASAPGAYAGIGWLLANLGYELLDCKGGLKDIHACMASAHDLTFLIEHGFFLMLVFMFIAGPLSLWLIFNTALKQLGKWHEKQKI